MGLYEFRRKAAKCDEHAKKREKFQREQAFNKKQRLKTAEQKKAREAALASPYLEIPDEMTLTEQYVGDVENRLYFNDEFADYFYALGKELDDYSLINASESIRNCHKKWYGEWYGMQRVFDLQSVMLCHNKFCSNCEHMKQASRLKRFTPVLEELSKEYDFYHYVLTVPNCKSNALKNTISRLIKAFTQIIRYFSGDAKLKDMDFGQYGFGGAVRCLECTVESDDYHAHIHSLLLLKKDLPLYKTVTNAYSFDYGEFKRKFCELEINLQRILYLIFNGQKVTKSAIDKFPDGYSCTLDVCDGEDWKEVFKYVTKLTKGSDGMTAISKEQLEALYFALKGRRAMQGYGKLYRLASDDSIDNAVTEEYARIRETLRLVEMPINLTYDINELIVDLQKGRFKVISKYAIQKYLNELSKDENKTRNL